MSSQKEVKAIYAPFEWVRPDVDKQTNAHFAALTIDICTGVKTCLQLIHASNMSRSSGAGDEDPPILNLHESENLLRFAIAATDMLAGEGMVRVERANEDAARITERRAP